MGATVTPGGRHSGGVCGEEAFDVALVEDADLDVGLLLAELADLAVLAGHERLAQCRDLKVEVVVRQVEVGSEGRSGIAVDTPLEHERAGLVVPGDALGIEEFGDPALRIVGELHRVRFGSERTDLGHDCLYSPIAWS